MTEQGQIIRMKAGDLRPIGRDTQGVRLMDLAEGDKLVSIATLRGARGDGGRTARTAEDRGRRRLAKAGSRTIYAGSSPAYFASSFFVPTAANLTVTLKSSPCSSMSRTVPTPNWRWRTRMPVRTPDRD